MIGSNDLFIDCNLSLGVCVQCVITKVSNWSGVFLQSTNIDSISYFIVITDSPRCQLRKSAASMICDAIHDIRVLISVLQLLTLCWIIAKSVFWYSIHTLSLESMLIKTKYHCSLITECCIWQMIRHTVARELKTLYGGSMFYK